MATHSILAWRIHGQRSLAGYSPAGHKERDTTEWLALNYCSRPSVKCSGRPGSCKLLQSHELGTPILNITVFIWSSPPLWDEGIEAQSSASSTKEAPAIRRQPIPTHTLNTSVSTMAPFYQLISALCLGVSSVCSQLFADSDGRPLRERAGLTGDRAEGWGSRLSAALGWWPCMRGWWEGGGGPPEPCPSGLHRLLSTNGP